MPFWIIPGEMTATYFSGKRLVALLGDMARHSSKRPEEQIVGSGRMVANPDITPVFGDYFPDRG